MGNELPKVMVRFCPNAYVKAPKHIHTSLLCNRAPGKPSLAGSFWAQREDLPESNVNTHRAHTTLVTPWTVALQAPLSMRFPRQEYWSGLPFPSLGDRSQASLQKAQGPGVCKLSKPPASRTLCQAKRAPRAAFPR